MRTTKRKTSNDAMDEIYRFRCHQSLKERAATVAKVRGYGDKSDIAREGVIAIIEAEEKRLGLKTNRSAK